MDFCPKFRQKRNETLHISINSMVAEISAHTRFLENLKIYNTMYPLGESNKLIQLYSKHEVITNFYTQNPSNRYMISAPRRERESCPFCVGACPFTPQSKDVYTTGEPTRKKYQLEKTTRRKPRRISRDPRKRSLYNAVTRVRSHGEYIGPAIRARDKLRNSCCRPARGVFDRCHAVGGRDLVAGYMVVVTTSLASHEPLREQVYIFKSSIARSSLFLAAAAAGCCCGVYLSSRE